MKRHLCQVVILLFISFLLISCGDNNHNSNTSSIEELITSVSDGTYTGVGEGLKGEIKVKVIVEDGKIVAINVIEYSETEHIAGGAIKEVPQKIIKAQSSKVDVYSGATHASKGIIEAVENALASADE